MTSTALRRVPLWAGFIVGLSASIGAGAVLDGRQADVASYGGMALSLVTGATIAQQPRIKAFLGATPTLWFLFLFNAVVSVVLLTQVDGASGLVGGGFMGVVSLGAAAGLWSQRRAGSRRQTVSDGASVEENSDQAGASLTVVAGSGAPRPTRSEGFG